MYLAAQNWNSIWGLWMYNFYPRTNYRHTLHMPGCISHLHAHPFPVFSLHHRGGTPELHFPESQAKEISWNRNPLFYSSSHIQASEGWWMGHNGCCQWFSKDTLRIILFVETAEIQEAAFLIIFVLVNFLKACRGFPDLCSLNPWNGLVNL